MKRLKQGLKNDEVKQGNEDQYWEDSIDRDV